MTITMDACTFWERQELRDADDRSGTEVDAHTNEIERAREDRDDPPCRDCPMCHEHAAIAQDSINENTLEAFHDLVACGALS